MADVLSYPGLDGIGFDATAYFDVAYGDVSNIVIQPTVALIDLGGGDSVAYLGTGITSSGSFITGGEINIIEFRIGGTLVSRMTDLTKDASQIIPFYLLGDGEGLMEWLYDGNDTITGSSASEVLNGFGGTDTINAGGGDDTVYLGANDVVAGGSGTDTFMIDASDLATNAVITDMTNAETIVVRDLVFTQSHFDRQSENNETAIQIDTDNDGFDDITLTLQGNFKSENFWVTDDGTNTTIYMGEDPVSPPPPPPPPPGRPPSPPTPLPPLPPHESTSAWSSIDEGTAHLSRPGPMAWAGRSRRFRVFQGPTTAFGS